MTIILTAFVMGFMGSFHCAGMCGPIAIALPLHGNTLRGKAFGGILYNLGRTVTYGIMGAIFGFLGQGLVLLGFQQWISVIMGSIMIITALFPSLYKASYGTSGKWNSLVGRLRARMGRLFAVRSFSSLFIIGLLNGLLPCGLVYMAIAGAIGTGNGYTGALFMILFGLGTIPMMLFISYAGNMLSGTVRNRINKLIPVLVVVVGLLFVLRGLNLGIPYLSPPREKIEMKFKKELSGEKKEMTHDSSESCCH